jgi:hypothetical protein
MAHRSRPPIQKVFTPAAGRCVPDTTSLIGSPLFPVSQADSTPAAATSLTHLPSARIMRSKSTNLSLECRRTRRSGQNRHVKQCCAPLATGVRCCAAVRTSTKARPRLLSPDYQHSAPCYIFASGTPASELLSMTTGTTSRGTPSDVVDWSCHNERPVFCWTWIDITTLALCLNF